MREGTERLSPYNAEVSSSLIADLGESPIEDVAQDCHTQANYHGLASLVVPIRHEAEKKRHGNLDEETD